MSPSNKRAAPRRASSPLAHPAFPSVADQASISHSPIATHRRKSADAGATFSFSSISNTYHRLKTRASLSFAKGIAMTGEHPPAGEGQEGAREKAPRSVGRKQRRESHLSLASLGASFSASAKGKGAAPHHRHELRPNLTEPQGGPSSLADLYNAGATDLRRSLEDFAFPTKTASTSTDPFFHTSEPPVPQPSTSAAAAFSPCTTSRSALESPIPATPLQGFADAHLERSQSTQPPMPHHRRPSSWGKNRLLAVASPLMCSPNFSEPVPSAHARSHSRSHSFQHDHQHHRCSLSSASRQTPRCSHTHDLSRASSAASHKISSHPQRRRSRSQLVYMLSDWGFCSLDLTHDELLHCCELLFEAALSLPADTEGNTCNGPTIGHAYGITPLQIRGFINAISALYVGSNAYHNFVHATDVLQAVYSFLCELGALPGLREALLPSARQELGHPAFDVRASPVRPADALAMLFAAIGHDAGHPGLSNAFLVNGKTTLARAFHDKSPLENYHALLLEGMLSLHGLDALVWQEQPLSEDSARPAEPSPRKRTAFGDMVRNCVLATDMALHFGFVTALEKFEERWNVHDEVLAAEVQKAVGLGIGVSDLHAFELPTNDGILEKRLARAKEMRVLPQADRTMLCSALIKCADVSNPARPTGVGRQWSLALRQEWSRQMALEQDCGLPATVGGSVRCCNKVASRPEVDRDELATTFAEDTVNQRRRSSAAQMVAGVGGGGGAHATWREYDLDEIDDLEEELALAKGQVCFVDLFVAPLFIAVGRVLPELEPFAQVTRSNHEFWKRRLSKIQISIDANKSSPSTEQAAAEELRLPQCSIPVCGPSVALADPPPTMDVTMSPTPSTMQPSRRALEVEMERVHGMFLPVRFEEGCEQTQTQTQEEALNLVLDAIAASIKVHLPAQAVTEDEGELELLANERPAATAGAAAAGSFSGANQLRPTLNSSQHGPERMCTSACGSSFDGGKLNINSSAAGNPAQPTTSSSLSSSTAKPIPSYTRPPRSRSASITSFSTLESCNVSLLSSPATTFSTISTVSASTDATSLGTSSPTSKNGRTHSVRKATAEHVRLHGHGPGSCNCTSGTNAGSGSGRQRLTSKSSMPNLDLPASASASFLEANVHARSAPVAVSDCAASARSARSARSFGALSANSDADGDGDAVSIRTPSDLSELYSPASSEVASVSVSPSLDEEEDEDGFDEPEPELGRESYFGRATRATKKVCGEDEDEVLPTLLSTQTLCPAQKSRGAATGSVRMIPTSNSLSHSHSHSLSRSSSLFSNSTFAPSAATMGGGENYVYDPSPSPCTSASPSPSAPTRRQSKCASTLCTPRASAAAVAISALSPTSRDNSVGNSVSISGGVRSISNSGSNTSNSRGRSRRLSLPWLLSYSPSNMSAGHQGRENATSSSSVPTATVTSASPRTSTSTPAMDDPATPRGGCAQTTPTNTAANRTGSKRKSPVSSLVFWNCAASSSANHNDASMSNCSSSSTCTPSGGASACAGAALTSACGSGSGSSQSQSHSQSPNRIMGLAQAVELQTQVGMGMGMGTEVGGSASKARRKSGMF